MEIWAPPQNNFLYNQIGKVCRYYTFEIGGWNMDVDENHTILHTLGTNFIYVNLITATIRSDTGLVLYVVGNDRYNVSGVSSVHVISLDSLAITLERIAGGFFDNITFNDDIINRGYITMMTIS